MQKSESFLVFNSQAFLKEKESAFPPPPQRVLRELRVSGELKVTRLRAGCVYYENGSWWVSQLSKEGFSLQGQGLVKINRYPEVINEY